MAVAHQCMSLAPMREARSCARGAPGPCCEASLSWDDLPVRWRIRRLWGAICQFSRNAHRRSTRQIANRRRGGTKK